MSHLKRAMFADSSHASATEGQYISHSHRAELKTTRVRTYCGEVLVWDLVVHSNPSGVVLLHIQRRAWRGAIEHNRISSLAVDRDVLRRGHKHIVRRTSRAPGPREHALGPKQELKEFQQHGERYLLGRTRSSSGRNEKYAQLCCIV